MSQRWRNVCCWRTRLRSCSAAPNAISMSCALYGPTEAVVVEVPNGVALDEIPSPRQQSAGPGSWRWDWKAADRPLLGSWHPPNLDAVAFILRLAEDRPETDFLIVGSAGHPFREQASACQRPAARPCLYGGAQQPACLARRRAEPDDLRLRLDLKMLDYFAAGCRSSRRRSGRVGSLWPTASMR